MDIDITNHRGRSQSSRLVLILCEDGYEFCDYDYLKKQCLNIKKLVIPLNDKSRRNIPVGATLELLKDNSHEFRRHILLESKTSFSTLELFIQFIYNIPVHLPLKDSLLILKFQAICLEFGHINARNIISSMSKLCVKNNSEK